MGNLLPTRSNLFRMTIRHRRQDTTHRHLPFEASSEPSCMDRVAMACFSTLTPPLSRQREEEEMLRWKSPKVIGRPDPDSKALSG